MRHSIPVKYHILSEILLQISISFIPIKSSIIYGTKISHIFQTFLRFQKNDQKIKTIVFLTKENDRIHIPGHGNELHVTVSLSLPEQSLPPYIVGGESQLRHLDRVPLPQLTEQFDHSVQLLHPPSTIIKYNVTRIIGFETLEMNLFRMTSFQKIILILLIV